MSSLSQTPRSLDYFILRTCERMHISEQQFHRLDYSDQIRLLSYHRIRNAEEALLLFSAQRRSS